MLYLRSKPTLNHYKMYETDLNLSDPILEHLLNLIEIYTTKLHAYAFYEHSAKLQNKFTNF